MRRSIWDFVLYRDLDPKDEETRDLYELAEEAAGWLFWDGHEKIDGEGRFSFLYICEQLDLDPAAVRERTLRMTRQDIQRLNNQIKVE